MKILVIGVIGTVATLLAGTVNAGGYRVMQPMSSAAYRVRVLESLGGSQSAGNSINDLGLAAGFSDFNGDRRRHATIWHGRNLTDLGTLGGPNSAVLWPVKNVRGLVVGISQTRRPDPLGENWSCSAFFPAPTAVGHQCLGFRSRRGVMRPLPTLGGTNGFATAANNAGQIVGWAENRVHDPTCVPPQVLQFRGVVWGRHGRVLRQLRPLHGDTVSTGNAINRHGVIAGISGICDQAVGRFSAIHAVLWRRGRRPLNLGTLGGVAWNTPMAINDHSVVVGFDNPSASLGGAFAVHAFVWTSRLGMRDLGTLPGDSTSQALGVTNHGEIVGTSCDANFNCRAVIWHNGHIADLNNLISRQRITLTTANDINNSGRITGQAVTTSGRVVAFVATPTNR
jgi:probable HAF family extracellular repeat protein